MLIGPTTAPEPRRRHGHGHSRVLLARTRSRLPRLRLAGLEADAVLADRRTLDFVAQREGDLPVVERLDRVALAVLRRDLRRLEDLDGAEARAVPRRHVLVHLRDGAREGHVTELLVQVVRERARVVADPDAEVLDGRCVLLVDLLAREDLTVGTLQLLELRDEVPEAALGDGGVRREEVQAVYSLLAVTD